MPTPTKSQAPSAWEILVAEVNAIIEARGMTLKAASEELGVPDSAQLHKWIRSKEGNCHEPKANIALRLAGWVQKHQSFLPRQRTGGK